MRLARPATIVAFVLLLVSCGDSTGPETFPGTYDLRSVGDTQLPYLVAQAGLDKLEVTAGVLRIEADDTFTLSLTFRLTNNSGTQETTDEETGTWSAKGPAITFTSEDGTSRAGSKAGDIIIVTNVGLPWLFEKRST